MLEKLEKLQLPNSLHLLTIACTVSGVSVSTILEKDVLSIPRILGSVFFSLGLIAFLIVALQYRNWKGNIPQFPPLEDILINIVCVPIWLGIAAFYLVFTVFGAGIVTLFGYLSVNSGLDLSWLFRPDGLDWDSIAVFCFMGLLPLYYGISGLSWHLAESFGWKYRLPKF